jgi:two-component sensor histidine kinase
MSQSCGLMINELVSNALKYAFSSTGENVIHVRFFRGEQPMLKLVVHDNGSISGEPNPEESDSLGLKLGVR